MILSQKYRITWLSIPIVIRSFLLKGLLLLIVWKLLYLLFLLPGRVLDDPLTRLIGSQTINTLNFFSGSHAYASMNIMEDKEFYGQVKKDPAIAVLYNNERTLVIADPCNGLELMVLYAGFILCLPSGKARKFRFIICGLLAIFILNIARCSLLTIIALNRPQYLNFSHHYVFNFIVYGCIFILWLMYTRKLNANAGEKN